MNRSRAYRDVTEPTMIPRCDLILVTWNQLNYTKACVESLLRCTSMPHRLIIVDNGSAQDTLAFLAEVEAQHSGRVVVVNNQQNLGWVKAVNEGLRYSRAPYVCLLNNDLIVTPGWLEQMIEAAEADPLIGLVNPTYNRSGGSLEEFDRDRARPRAAGALYVEINECNGACMLIRRAVLDVLGGLDETYGLGGMDDFDYSRCAEVKGFRCARAKNAYVFHWENVTYDSMPKYWSEERRQNVRTCVRRWGERKQLTVVLAEPNHEVVVRRLQQCLALARLGLRIHIWALLPRQSPLHHASDRWRFGIAEHNNLKWTVWPQPSRMPLNVLWCGWLSVMAAVNGFGRRWKKTTHRIQGFIVPSNGARAWLQAFRWLHGSPVYQSFERCPEIEREGGWARSIDTALWSDGRTDHE